MRPRGHQRQRRQDDGQELHHAHVHGQLPSRFRRRSSGQRGPPGHRFRHLRHTAPAAAACPRGALAPMISGGRLPSMERILRSRTSIPARPRRRFRPRLWPRLATRRGSAGRARHLAGRAAAVEGGAGRGARGALAAPAAPLPAQRRLASVGIPPRRGRPAPSVTTSSSCSAPLRSAASSATSADPAGAAGRRRGPGGSRLGPRRPGASGGAPRGPGRGRGRGHRHRPLPRRGPRPTGSRPTTSRSRSSGSATTCRRWSAALGLELLPVVVEADATPNPGGLPIGGRTADRAAQQPPAIRDHLVRPRGRRWSRRS